MLFGQRTEPPFVSADQDRFRPEGFTVAELQTALLPDRHDGSGEMLSASHSAGDAVHNDFQDSIGHSNRSVRFFLPGVRCISYMIYEGLVSRLIRFPLRVLINE